jgi:ABC-type multidrug transport system fused ATPase/permease subunit/CRP-like cAMP-binding protein
MSTPAATPASPVWQQSRSAHLLLMFQPDSYAARMIDEIAARAEAAYEAGRDWFGEDTAPPTIAVYLADWRQDMAAPGWVPVGSTIVATDHDTICVPVSPEQPAVGLERAILELHVRAAAGAVPLRLSGYLPALAALIVAEHRGPLDGKAEDRAAHQRYGRGKETPRLFAAKDPRLAETVDPADFSFLLFLQRSAGRVALARFVRGTLTSDLEAAATAAYARSLATLQAEWLASLPARARGAATGQDVLRRALHMLRPYRLRVVAVLVLMSYDLAFAMAIPLSTKILFDDILGARDFSILPIWLAAMFVAFSLGAAITYRRMMVAGWIAESILRDLRRAMFTHLQALSLRFYARASTGDLMSRMTNDLDNVDGALSGTLPSFIYSVLSLSLGTIALLLLNWILGLIVLVLGVPIFAVVYVRASERLRQASREQQERYGLMTAALQENLLGQPVIKSFSLQQRAIRLFEQIMGDLFQGSMRLIRIGGVLSSSTEMVGLGIRLTVMAVGAWMILNDQLTAGGLVAFLGLIGEVLGPVVSISEQYSHLQRTSGALERIEEVLDEVPDVVEDPLAVDLPPLEREIRLEHLTFSYEHGEAALRDVTLTIPAGARAAIVGPSGAGKSTLAGLLLRHYDGTSGRILFDGKDIREATLTSLRDQLGLVPQDTFLFDLSVQDNILLGREGATPEAAVAAARAAALHEVIERRELGYDTMIGERGVRLSGGQRQRLAIARALLRDPRVLILDEATSALDAETEAAILDTLARVAQGRTLIMITHRLAAAARCDLIFVLDQGRLVEHGTHQELLQQRGLYWRLSSEQQAGAFENLDLPIDLRRLSRVPLLAQLSPAELALVAVRVTVEHYSAGAVVVRQGEIADKLFVIGDGQLEVVVDDPRGEPRHVTVLGAHSYFGEIALLNAQSARRMATVRALGPVELYSLHREDFAALLRAQPSLAQEISALARRRIEQVRDLLATAASPAPAAEPDAPTPPAEEMLARRSAGRGSSAPRALLTLLKGAQVGRANVLDGRVVTIGRSIENGVHLQDNAVSRRHCRIYWADDAYLVEDLGSSNGTYVNGAKTEKLRLRDGDIIQVGDHILQFSLAR